MLARSATPQEAEKDTEAPPLALGRASPRPSDETARSPVRYGLPPWRLQRALDHIEQNLSRAIRLGDLAAATRLSPHHFSALFRESTGFSPYRYVLLRRVERAKVLLRDSSLGVLDIGLCVGFSDQSHFSKVFRRITGVSPGAYRVILWAEGAPAGFPEDQTKLRSIVLTRAALGE